MDAVGARLIARRRHHAAAAPAARIGADHHRAAGERGILPHLDGGVEGVEIGVQDGARRVGHRTVRAHALARAGAAKIALRWAPRRNACRAPRLEARHGRVIYSAA